MKNDKNDDRRPNRQPTAPRRRLALRKEMLRNLSAQDLADVGGGTLVRRAGCWFSNIGI
jgi:hypothetical protein